jgi:uncharacterized protein YuzE
MKIDFDPQANALYPSLRDGKVQKTQEIRPGVILDFDKTGNILGVEVLYGVQRAEQPAAVARRRSCSKRQVA